MAQPGRPSGVLSQFCCASVYVGSGIEDDVIAYCSSLSSTRDENKMRLFVHVVRDEPLNIDLSSLEGTGGIAARLLQGGQRNQNEMKCEV